MNDIIIEDLILRPLTSKTWNDFELLFGPKGAYGGCWCMWWRIPRKEFEAGQGQRNHDAMKAIVESGKIPGLIAYKNDVPCGWCSVAPREHYATIERSRVLKRLDDQPVWSLVCFFIDKKFRGLCLNEKLIRAAVQYVKSQGGKIIEAYPANIHKKNMSPVSTFTGIPSILEKVGFKEVGRPSNSKIIMRYYIDQDNP
jgi:GNAT superfamily N-acetyltransferase